MVAEGVIPEQNTNELRTCQSIAESLKILNSELEILIAAQAETIRVLRKSCAEHGNDDKGSNDAIDELGVKRSVAVDKDGNFQETTPMDPRHAQPAEELARTLVAAAPTFGDPWTNAQYLNGWTTKIDGLMFGEVFSGARYVLDPLGFVHFDGVITGGNVGGYDSSSASFFLDGDFSPDSWQALAVITHVNTIGRIDVMPDGEVHMAIGSNSWVSLCGITIPSSNIGMWVRANHLNSWITYPDDDIVATSFFKDAIGMVHLDGLIIDGLVRRAAFRLPSGYRPEYQQTLPIITHSNTIGRIDVLTTGEVMITDGSNGYVSLAGLVFASAGIGSWIEARCINGWQSNWASTSIEESVAAPARFFKDEFGFVHLEGIVKFGIVGVAAFLLPEGMRPEYHQVFHCQTFPSTIGRVDVLPSGFVVPAAGSAEWFSISGISFRGHF